MDSTIDKLGTAQGNIKEAARCVAEVSNRFMADGGWGTQRLDYVARATVHLNSAWSLIRAATNYYPTLPSVRTAIEGPVPKPRTTRRAAKRTR